MGKAKEHKNFSGDMRSEEERFLIRSPDQDWIFRQTETIAPTKKGGVKRIRSSKGPGDCKTPPNCWEERPKRTRSPMES